MDGAVHTGGSAKSDTLKHLSSQGSSSNSISLTEQIYSNVREGNYPVAISILEAILQTGKKDRSVFSVLGFCYFNTGDFQGASTCYEELVKICPEIIDYQHHLAQCLFKVGRMDEALELCNSLLDS
jgi:tetratricopeptide (TPR) repeat protein